LLGIVISGFIIYTSIEGNGSKEYIWFEAENANKIDPSLEIFEDKDASGGKAIVSTITSHRVEAFASYNFNISNVGDYYFWARVYWPGGCNNTYLVQIDNSKPIIYGNEDQFNIWHWVPSLKFNLKKGKHTLFIWNEEQNARLDKMLITADPYFIPQGLGEKSKDFLVNFENGKPDIIKPTTPLLWTIDSMPDKNRCYHELNNKKTTMEYSIINVPDISKGAFSCLIRKDSKLKNSCTSILFNFIDSTNYYSLDINENSAKISMLKDGKASILTQFKSENNLIDTIFHLYTIILDNPLITIKKDGKSIMELINSPLVNGKIGFGSPKGGVYFDDLTYTSDIAPIYSENFFDQLTTDELKKGVRGPKWIFHRGVWTPNVRMSMCSLEANAGKNQDALVTTGQEYWRNYSYTAAIKIEDEAGLCFCVQDKENYYVSKIIAGKESIGKMQVVKICSNKMEILKERNVAITKGEWYKVSVRIYNDSISSFLNDSKIIECNDRLFQYGGIGFWCKGSEKVSILRDIIVQPSSNKIADEKPNGLNQEYSFNLRLKAGIEFCDWENSINIFQELPDGMNIRIRKKILEGISMVNRKLFTGDFNVQVHHFEKISNDVDGNVLLFVDNNGKEIIYKIIFGYNKLTISKGNDILKELEIIIDRSYYSVSYERNTLLVKADNKILLNYPVTLDNQSTRIGIGYSGIGEGDIFLGGVKLTAEKILTNLK
jgi:hypothetical protein